MNKIIQEQLLISTDIGLVSISIQEEEVKAILVSSGMLFDLPEYSGKEELLTIDFSNLTLNGYYLAEVYVVNNEYTFSYEEDDFQLNITFKRGDLIDNTLYNIPLEHITPMLLKEGELYYPDTVKVVDNSYGNRQFGRFNYQKFLGTWE